MTIKTFGFSNPRQPDASKWGSTNDTRLQGETPETCAIRIGAQRWDEIDADLASENPPQARYASMNARALANWTARQAEGLSQAA